MNTLDRLKLLLRMGDVSRPEGRLTAGFACLVLLSCLWSARRWSAGRVDPIIIAVADSFSGRSGFVGPQVLSGEQMAVDAVNRAGGIDGRRVVLTRYDDRSTAEGAQSNVAAIAASPAIAVLGHYLSVASVAAGAGYKEAHIPALTPIATADAVTQDNPYYFRAMFVISAQGRQVARYLNRVLHVPSVTLVFSDDVIGKTYLAGFQPAYSGRLRTISYANKAPDHAGAVRTVVEQLRAGSQQDALLVLAMVDADARELLLTTRRQGLTMPVFGHRDIGRNSFAEQFANEPEEQATPGYFTDGVMASTPMILDSTGKAAQVFAEQYAQRYRREPGWVEARAYEATRLLLTAVARAHVHGDRAARQRDREAVRSQLAAIDSPANAVMGLTGPLYFNAGRDMEVPVRIGVFHGRHFASAPVQLVPVAHPELVDVKALVAAGNIIDDNGNYFWQQRVVYTGIDVIELSRLDLKTKMFYADFYLWMRYSGDDRPTRIEFPSLVKKEDFDPEKPLEAGEDGGLHYRLYRVSGEFKANYDLHDYPFDVQELAIRFQNTSVPRDQLTYVIDSEGLRASTNDEPYGSLQSWRFKTVRYSVDTSASESTRGRTALFHTAERIEYPGFTAFVVLKRRFSVFLLKSMVTLVLLILVVFTTLFLPHSLLKERVTIPVTGILTSAVLLAAINNQMSEVSYTMAIEWLFYVFFALCLLAMIVAVLEEHLKLAHQERWRQRLNIAGKLGYVLAVLGVMAFYWFNYVHVG